MHGVYKPGNVELRPEILDEHQKYAAEKLKTKEEKLLHLVFLGGSASSVQEFRTGIDSRVVKVNIDTD